MPTSKASSTPNTAAPAKKATVKSKPPASDALALLAADHKEVSKLFKDYEKLLKADADGDDRGALAVQICEMLTVHATIEEEIFYPALREAAEADDLLDEAEVEHATVKDLIAQIESMDPSDELYDAKVTVLGEYVTHHVQEEESDIFAKAKKSKVDFNELGEQLQNRKQELMDEAETAAA